MSVRGIEVSMQVNGERRAVKVFPMARLIDVLREQCGLTGTKEGCGEGECGACSVFVDGRLVNSCLIPCAQVDGSEVTTIEGLSAGQDLASLHPIQRAFLTHGGAQCGICTPGMVLATVELLRRYPDPDEEQIREGLSGNLCRCTGYIKIFDAVREAARLMRAEARS